MVPLAHNPKGRDNKTGRRDGTKFIDSDGARRVRPGRGSNPAGGGRKPSTANCRAGSPGLGYIAPQSDCPDGHSWPGSCTGRLSVDQPKYRAFISYSHRDSQWANWLHRSLEAYRPPKALIGTYTTVGVVPKRLAPIFRDREELASATDLGSVLKEALAQSACQIVICSPQ